MRYNVEFLGDNNKWYKTYKSGSRIWCEGYVEGRTGGMDPHPAMRVVHDSGKVTHKVAARHVPSFGMIAGWPSVAQIEEAQEKLARMLVAAKPSTKVDPSSTIAIDEEKKQEAK